MGGSLGGMRQEPPPPGGWWARWFPSSPWACNGQEIKCIQKALAEKTPGENAPIKKQEYDFTTNMSSTI